MAFKWKSGANITLEEKQQSRADMEVFRQCVDWNFLTQANETPSSAFMILPCGIGKHWYRDVLFDNKKPQFGWSDMAITTLLALPQIVIPYE